MIEQALKSLLLNDDSVDSATLDGADQVADAADVLGPLIGTRIYAVQLPRNATQLMTNGMPPSVFFYRLDTTNQACHDGPLDLIKAIVRLHAVAADPDTNRKVLKAVDDLVGGWSGTAGKGADGAITVCRLWGNNSADVFENPIGAAEFGLAESIIDIEAWFKNPV